MTNSEEWQEILEDFVPKTEEQKRKEVEAETKRLQLPLPDMIIRNGSKLLYEEKPNKETKGKV